jgi:predicted ATP-grasp superfamily ATP-dependent carboligase
VKPVILLATTRRWPPVARLAMAFVNAGFRVEVVCPRNHPVTRTRAITRTFPYSGIAPLDSFAAAISAVKPDLIVPGDDLAAEQLHALYSRECIQQDHAADAICSLLARSLGSPESFGIVHERSIFIQAAGQEGIRIPKTATIKDLTELKKVAQQFGFPMVLKANGTSGGEGVRVVRSLEEAERALRNLQAPPFWVRALKRAILDADTTLIRPWLAGHRSVVSAQSYIAGREATSLVVCWKGQVLAALHFEVLNKGISAGPASVLRSIENDEMSNAAEKVVRRLNLSGLQGFDFMLEANTGHAYLIEINPRCTQVGHLTLGAGRDLPAALYSALTGTALREAPKVTEKDTIALFPQEWVRDSKSEYLKVAYHDVPWEEPELVNTCIRMSRKWTSLTSQRDRIKAFWLLADSANENSKEAVPQPLVAEQGK